MTFLPSIAARNVIRNARRSAITLSAIAIGVAVLVLLKGFSDGFISLVVASVVDGRTGALQIHRAGYFKDREALPLQLSMPQSSEWEARVQQVEGVKGLAPRIHFSGWVGDGTSQATFLGTAIDPAAEKRACPNWGKDILPGGEDLPPSEPGHSLVGVALAKSFKAAPGSRLDLSTTGPTGRLNAMEVSVSGITETAFRFDNKRQLAVPLRFAQDLLGMPGQVTEYAVSVTHLDALDDVATRLRVALGPEYEVQTWREVQPYMYGVVGRQEAVVLIFAFIFFTVIAIGIANATSSSVLERTREVGTMLAFGMRRRTVVALFLLEALLVGAAAGVLGSVLGRVAVAVIAHFGVRLKQMVTPGSVLVRPEVSVRFTVLVVLVAALVAVLSSVVSAFSASRKSPADALRS